jgi:hypothetical protein
MWESFVGCKAFSELASLQIGCSTLKTTLKSSEWRRSVDNSVLFSEVFRVGQPTCKFGSSEMALQSIIALFQHESQQLSQPKAVRLGYLDSTLVVCAQANSVKAS